MGEMLSSSMERSYLDGPDGSQCYWHDLRIEEQLISNRPFGGGFVMIWGAFSASSKAKLVLMESRQNFARYISVLEESVVPFLLDVHNNTETFQQDN